MARLLSCHLRCILTLLFFIGHFSWSVAQIKIGGNVYGGGNAGDMTGNTSVTVSAGDIQGNVFGGARQANVGGHAYVDIDGEHMSDNIVINHVYGGNDIAGTVGESIQETDPIPSELTEAVSNEITATAGTNTKQYSAFVLTTPERKVTTTTGTGNNTTTTTTQPYHLFIGQVFGGGNGNYDYDSDDSPYKGKTKPDLTKTYLEIKGGTIAYLFGGGNCATVTGATDICIKNTSTTTTDAELSSIITTDRLHAMGVNTVSSHVGSTDYQFNRVFGGNNEVAMDIRPTWHLKEGKIRDLYSGGNAGDMTSPDGILLTVQSKDMKIHNVYGGCRMANVNPAKKTIPALSGYTFPAGYAARVLIDAGDIDNVYGGNDVSGNIYGGNALGIHSSINNDVYGGGNGSYPYTDNTTLKNYDEYKDFYYEPGSSSVDALNAFRPNAEAVSIRVVGTEAKPTVIGGAIYCGGNSATLRNDDPNKNATAQLKIGSYVIADKVFLGNNGENMVTTEDGDPLRLFAKYVNVNATDGSLTLTETGTSKFNSMNLTNSTVFAKYMEGCAMRIKPEVVFDDVGTYEPYSTKFGSFYCGGNVGSMIMDGKQAITFKHPVIIFDKLVGGCNTAYVKPTDWNAEYEGGIRGDADTNGDKLQLDLAGLKIQPMRWKMKTVDNKEVYDLDSNGNRQLEWNTFVDGTKNLYTADNTSLVPTAENTEVNASANDIARRFRGGNIYGGCYESGLVNGNVIINIDGTIIDRDGEHGVFDSVTADEEGEAILYGHEKEGYKITARRSGVILDEQGMDVLGSALSVFGGGYGEDSEIWGSTTINLNKGYVFQIFGGGEQGAIGKGTRNSTTHVLEYKTTNLTEEDEEAYKKYSTYINLHGEVAGVSKGATLTQAQKDNLAEAEFIYGGGFEGLICGDTHVYLGNGRIFNSFAGSCNADILGHTETYVGKGRDANGTVVAGFPWIRDHIYGGNDLGGRIHGSADFSGNVSDFAKTKAYGYSASEPNPSMIASAYMEYTQGRVDRIFGGCYGDYDYSNDFNNADYSFEIYNGSDTHTGSIKYFKPYLHNAFVNFKPNNNSNNLVKKVLGAGQGFSGDRDGDKVQDRSYVLVDIADATNENFKDTEFFGAGAFNGLGMRYSASTTFGEDFDLNTASATIDLMRGRVSAAYGGSYEEGITRRTLVNVPEGSTIKTNNIFGGAYGLRILQPCDVYEANVNYQSDKAYVNGAIYGGNNNVRRTLYAKVNISTPVKKENGYTGKIFGAGRGEYTWAEYTEVNLESEANVYEVYGGGELGNVLNAESVQTYLQSYKDQPADMVKNDVEYADTWGNSARWNGTTLKDEYKAKWQKVWRDTWTIGDYYDANADNGFTGYVDNPYVNLKNALVREAEIDDRNLTTDQEGRMLKRYNTNIIINRGATVGGYVYGGGYGSASNPQTGGVFGSTYTALLGGTVVKDIYAAGTTGSVSNLFGADGFTATTNAYIKGGSVRNVYGGGWEGSVGFHAGSISASKDTDIEGEAHVVVGVVGDDNNLSGNPAINRNIYGGGEGGSIYGTSFVTLNNGHIGYKYEDNNYVAVLDDAEAGDNLLDEAGNIFGGGYVANSYTDFSDITMYGGTVRGCLYGGGEIGPIGRGSVLEDAPAGIFTNDVAKIYKGGRAKVTMYGGLVMRDVFGGGRGFDNWGGDGTRFIKEEVKATMDLSSKGYVFGSTDVRIRGGVVGTSDNVAKGYGNVFGGGNVGFVYSATGTKHGERGETTLTEGLPTNGGGYYYSTWDATTRTNSKLSQDCSVVIEPYCMVTADGGISIDGQPYAKDEYVPIEDVNKLGDKNADASQWSKIDYESGVTIRNAVFAGGNVTVGSDQVFVNTATVFGNVTVALRDAYNRDLITIGTEHTGGLYGDGNLTMVDGYREVHIDNYGTDYYSTDEEISKETYNSMSDRERAYFVLNYKAKAAISVTGTLNGKPTTISINANDRLSSDEFKEKFGYDFYNKEDYPVSFKTYINADGTPNLTYFDEMGFCSLYAGRLLNTIQRCDMAAVFGSRIVLQGARDRVPEKVDYTRYTLNRVGELSLNQRTSWDDANSKHGNYFGIYSKVNYLGNLTSDVKFDDVRVTDSSDPDNQADGKTYYGWKEAKHDRANRNNATSPNKVSLASGVYLELIREESEKLDHTEWGYITGVIELDLIDVKTGLGGGYVYARNEHGVKYRHDNWSQVYLSPYNASASTYRRFTYGSATENVDDDATKKVFETSGNFVHNTKEIVDDCYPTVNAYKGSEASPAHYWYIRGRIYVYDQYISAYTGSANAYAETVSIPLTISAASHGKMTLRDVQPNLYAYYGEDGQPLGQNSIVINGVTYHAGDPIDYWSYQMLSTADQSRFESEVYTTIAECTYGTGNNAVTYPAGSVFLPGDKESPKEGTYNYLKKYALKKKLDPSDTEAVAYVHDEAQDKDVAFDFVFRPANNLGHSTGYVLTYDMNNPAVWDDYYTRVGNQVTVTLENNEQYTYPDIISKETYEGLNANGQEQYRVGPTYKSLASGVFGQKKYTQGEIITGSIVSSHPANHLTGRTDQAAVEQAYVMTAEKKVKNKENKEQHLYPGSPVYQSDYTSDVWASMSKSPAKVCTSTLQLSETEYIYAGSLLSTTGATSEYTTLLNKVKEMNSYTTDAQAEKFLEAYLDDAYYVTKDGLYGGAYYEAGKSYAAIDAWSSMSETDRENFRYNYDGLDLLIDDTYGGDYGFKPQYDGYMPGTSASAIKNGTASPQYQGCIPLNPINYAATKPIDFEAEFDPTTDHQNALGANYADGKLTYTDEEGKSVSIAVNDRIKRPAYEDIPNERVHWSPILVEAPGTYYVVKKPFIKGDIPYTVGQTIEEKIFNTLTEDQQNNNIDQIEFGSQYVTQTGTDDKGNPIYDKIHYYYCREEYTVGEKGEGVGFKVLGNTGTNNNYNSGATVRQGTLIDADNYKQLKNLQTGFTIYGTAPIETSTLYVNRESDIYNLSKEKIITVIYMYEYQQSDESGNNITPISERHIVNIHINFESGAPEIGPLADPSIVLPGTMVGLKLPTVEPGAFEITSSGWEIFTDEDDAKMHKNGQPYINNGTPMYWYQNGYWVAYYAQTYLGKTYSNPVQFSVANYHDLKKVMEAKEHHYYIDHADVDRDPKIYINDYSADETGSTNGLDLLKNLFDLSVLNFDDDTTDPETGLITSGEFAGHKPLGELVKGGENLDIILRADIEHTGTWTPIGDTECFGGTLHGDGHTISGLDHSLFNKLCGDVFNLGVKGEFASTGNDIADAGIAETGSGYVENCWVYNSSTGTKTSKPVFNNPTGGDGNRLYRIVNCYYQEEDDAANKYTNHTGSYGIPTQMTAKSFFNGEVAYDLNGFYLYKRYNDHITHSGTPTPFSYFVDDIDTDGNSILTLKDDGKYDNDAKLCSSGYNGWKYVEDRFADGDFIYAGGEIPENNDLRLYTDPTTKETSYYPIWPDDYIFFGQRLNYGQVEGRTHQEHPSSIIKSGVRITADETGNRVYRAPAYFRSSKMGVAHFNPYAVFAKVGYKDMTAIDFTGYNDVNYDYVKGWSQWSESSQSSGKSAEAYAFYPPLLDEDGLSEFRNIDLTQNLLAYTYDAGKTNDVVNAALPDVAYAELNTAEKPAKYRAVAYADPSSVRGHHVQLSDDSYVATNDHFLVDKQDFDAPIGYQFVEDESAQNHRMWYQRTPDKYVETTWSGEGTSLTRTTKGWEGVSLPFTAEIVTTHQKGEITHFYSGSEQSKNGTDTKIGHEYWLREFTAGGKTEGNVYKANFNYPSSVSDDDDKEVTNTFLWDYYYEAKNGHNQLDANQDVYQTYYNNSRTYNKYARLMSDKPYIIGFPGDTFYEFDLSGKFSPVHTASWDKYVKDLAKQIITFASEEGTQIGVSDEVTGTAFEGYTFKPSYLNMALEAGTNSYVLSEHGDSYDKVPAASETPVEAFRPYFVDTPSGNGAKRRLAERIIFDMSDGSSTFDNDPRQDEAGGELIFYTKTHLVGVKSTLNKAIDVLIVNTSGQTIGSFTIHGGETVETPVPSTGVYIIRAAGGKYNRKVTIK